MMPELWYIGLVIVGSASPLLTLLYLWQLKEWRIDRLTEHLNRDGWWHLWGKLRLAIAVVWLGVCMTLTDTHTASTGALICYAVLSGYQGVTRRQRLPVWTQKARLLLLIASVITVGWSMVAMHIEPPLSHLLLPATVLLQSVFVLVAWLITWPLDYTLKQRIMKQASALRRSHPDLKVVGITGSVGKTSTKEMLAHILSDMNAVATPAHVNSEMGVSNWLRTTLSKESPDILVVEMGAYKRGEIAKLCSIAQPQYGVITYIGTQHLALFGSQEALCEAKSEMITNIDPAGQAFVNADNTYCKNVASKAVAPVTLVGTGGTADVEAYDIEETATGIVFRVGDTNFDVQMQGTHNVTNALLAIAVAQKLGMSVPDIAQKLATWKPPSKTFVVEERSGVTILNDTHNSSPASFQAAAAWARSQPADYKTLLASGLIELGKEQDRIHYELGAQCKDVFDRVIFLDKRGGQAFAKGFDAPVEMWNRDTKPVTPGSLLVCEGRLSDSVIASVLPNNG